MSASPVRVLACLVLTALISTGMWSRPASAETYLFYGTPGEAVVAQMMNDLGSVFESLQGAKQSKEEINAEFADARSSVVASCAEKIHDEAAEAKLASLLEAKDIYFLTFAMAGYNPQARSAVQGLDDATGGPLDSGIPLSAEFMFDRWANSVRAELEQSSAWDSAAIVSAISHSQQTYIQYVIFRNKAEIDDLAKGFGQSQGAVDPSPKALADAYLSNVLEPAIASSARSAEEKTAESQWAEEVRAAIIVYENGQLDPKAIAEHLRQDNYSSNIVEQFINSSDATNADLVEAYENAWEAQSALEGNPGMIPPSRDRLLLSLKMWSGEGAVAHLGGLTSNDALMKVGLNPVDAYLSKREVLRIMAGPSQDWCTGKPLH